MSARYEQARIVGRVEMLREPGPRLTDYDQVADEVTEEMPLDDSIFEPEYCDARAHVRAEKGRLS